MKNRGHSSGFGPRLTLPSSKKKSTSQIYIKSLKQMKVRQTHMTPVARNRNINAIRKDNVVTYKVHVRMLKAQDRLDKVAPKVWQNSPDHSKVRLSNIVDLNKNKIPMAKSARNSNRALAPIRNYWNVEPSKPYIAMDEFSPKSFKKENLPRSKDNSNATLGCPKILPPLQVKEESIHKSGNIGRSNSRQNHVKEIPGLAHKAKNVDQLNRCNNSIDSKSKGPSNLDRDGRTVTGKVHFVCDDLRKQEDLLKAKEAPNSRATVKNSEDIQDFWRKSGNILIPIFGKDLSRQMVGKSCVGNNMEQNDSKIQITRFADDGITDDHKFWSKRKESLPDEKPETQYHSEGGKCRPMKRRRRYIDNEDEEVDGGDQNLVEVKDGSAGLTTAITTDHHTNVSTPSGKWKQHAHPIDEPVWSGIFKIGSKEYVSLAAHLSTKYCDKVGKLSRSLLSVVEVSKLSRLEAWPKRFEASGPTDNDIALFFFPHEMRPDEELDQLVKEVMENDMVLRAVIGTAEMLIFPSTLLPEQCQTFLGKHYLWGLFKPRVVQEQQHGTGRCVQKKEIGKQHASHRGVGKENVEYITKQAKSSCAAGSNMNTELEAPKDAQRRGKQLEPAPSLARSNALPRLAERAAEATPAPTAAVAMSANRGQINSSLGVPPSAMFGFVVRQTPKVEQLIQEMQREGAVVVAMRGEMITSGLG